MIERYEVLVNKEKPEAIAKVREVIKKINKGEEVPEYSNNLYVRFQYMGSILDSIDCMAAGAASVGKA